MEKKDKSNWLDWLRKKFKIVAHNEITYEERWSFSLSPLNIITLTGIFTILIGFLTYLLLAYSPFKLLLPWHDDSEYREMAMENMSRVDSLNDKLYQYEKYVNDLRKVILGEDFDDVYLAESQGKDSSAEKAYEKIEFSKSEEDSLLRLKVEMDHMPSAISGSQKGLSGLLFYSPLKGKVSQSFDLASGHKGVDIVSVKDTPIKTTLDGTVIFSGWTPEDGNTIIISHVSNFISVYKHNSSLLKKEGERVKAGDAIAIIGNTGKHSTGMHLHFELWHDQKPVNPQDYISFK